LYHNYFGYARDRAGSEVTISGLLRTTYLYDARPILLVLILREAAGLNQVPGAIIYGSGLTYLSFNSLFIGGSPFWIKINIRIHQQHAMEKTQLRYFS
jgi:hypothetical protein